MGTTKDMAREMFANEAKALERFVVDTAYHSMKIPHNEGVYRHLSFTHNGSSIYRFDLITWPGHLTITGDMGCYTFARINDMFEFFRSDGDLGINPGYWDEKIQSGSSNRKDVCREFDREAFIDAVKDDFVDWEFDDDEQEKEIWEEVKNEVLYCADDSHSANDAVYRFKSTAGHEFVDFWDHNLERHTFHYLWCCWAIVHGIAEFDKTTKGANNA